MARPIIKSTGAFTPPPPGAPQEVSQPLTSDALAQMRAKAQANERELAPLTATGPKPIAKTERPSPGLVGPRGQPLASSEPSSEEYVAQLAARLDKASETMDGVLLVPPPLDADTLARMPAASNTDSPSRGIPQPLPPDKAITGGFGELEGDYFALTGLELREKVRAMLGDLDDLFTDDLRLSEAIIYQHARVGVTLAIHADPTDQSFVLEKGGPVPAPANVPLTGELVAEAIRDYFTRLSNDLDADLRFSIAVVYPLVRAELTVAVKVDLPGGKTSGFDLTAVHSEEDTPADQVRDELGLPKPAKHRVGSLQTPFGMQTVDVDT